MPDELIPTPPPESDPPPTSAHCPECGAEFDGLSITHASETLAALREENSSLKQELAAEKQKHPAPAPQPPQPEPEPQTEPAPATPKKRGRMLYGKRAAA